MTDRSSVPENAPGLTALGRNTHRVEAVNAAAPSADDDRSDMQRNEGASHAHPPSGFDFRLTRSTDTPTATGTVLELFTGYLVAASHAHGDALETRLDVTRVVVDGTVSDATDAEPTYNSAVTSVAVTIHVETTATEAALERWRRTLRDAEETQAAVPADVAVSIAVTRAPASPSR